jgi:hypothetical protein
MTNTQTDLTHEDMTILIEAVDEWVSKGLTGEMMGDIFGAMLLDKSDPEQKAKWEQEREMKRLAQQVEKEQRKETATLLKAKLIMLRRTTAIG